MINSLVALYSNIMFHEAGAWIIRDIKRVENRGRTSAPEWKTKSRLRSCSTTCSVCNWKLSSSYKKTGQSIWSPKILFQFHQQKSKTNKKTSKWCWSPAWITFIAFVFARGCSTLVLSLDVCNMHESIDQWLKKLVSDQSEGHRCDARRQKCSR